MYFLAGDSLERLKSNPKLELAAARGIEVLLLTDPVDAFWTSAPLDFEGKPLKSLSQGDVDFGLIPLLDDARTRTRPKPDTDEAATIAVIKDTLGDRVSDVRASQRLTSSASCLVAGSHGPDRELERLLAQQNRGAAHKADPRDQPAPSAGGGDFRQQATPPPICRSCCWSRRRSSTANCRRIPRRLPAGSTGWCCAG